MKHLLLYLFFPLITYTQWQPDAGVIASYTDTCTLSASSGTNLSLITDGDDDSNWVSDAPFPNNYISRTDQNVFLNYDLSYTASSNIDTTKITDTDLNTATTIQLNNDTASLFIYFDSIRPLKYISTKLAADSTISIYAFTTMSDSFLVANSSSTNNFQLQRFELQTDSIVKLKLVASSSFMLYEMAGLASNPKESVTIDLGESKAVGKIYARHWCGVMNGFANAEKVELQISEDQQNWEVIADLVPDALPLIVTDLVEEKQTRYIRFEYTLRAEDFLKVFFWEVDVYDQNGKYGPIPVAQASTVNLRELLGVSSVWGWGNNKYSDLLMEGQGPDLYAPIFSHGRNYHNMTWDVFDPDNVTDFNTMAKGNGTEVFPWLNWNREYEQWDSAGLSIQASIQFSGFADTVWTNPEIAAYNYGLDYAKHFGFTTGSDLISLIEVGNEPWNYDSTTYQQILHGMATGAKAGDPNMKVIPCALQAFDPFAELPNAPFNNYIGSRIDPQTLPFLDGLNSHVYSYDNRPDGMRYASYPEHINSSMREIFNILRFRDVNMPGKPVYCTEWGWDHPSSGTEDCTHDECVSEQAAASYAVRGTLMLMRLGIERATWYFYGDTKETSSLYTRSGVAGSVRNSFTKKDSYRSLQTLINNVGDKYFLSVVQEDEEAWVYVLGDSLNHPTHIVAWRPIEGDSLAEKNITIQGKYIPLNALRLDGKDDKGSATRLPLYQKDSISLEISSIPTLIRIDSCMTCPDAIAINPKIYLEGAFDPLSNLMQDSLNRLKLLPMIPLIPSTDSLGQRTINEDVFERTGAQAVLDWVQVELWEEQQQLATRTVLLLRNGQITDVDGVSAVTFYGFEPGMYDIVIRHRNHLPIRTGSSVFLDALNGN